MNLSLALRYSLGLSAVASAGANVRGNRRLASSTSDSASSDSSKDSSSATTSKDSVSDTSSSSVDRDMGDFTAPHEIHQYEQVKYEDETEWACREVAVAGQIGCIKCWNPRPIGEDALIVEVKAMYKRANLEIKDESVNEPRKHCIYPLGLGGPFYSCFNSNLVIEPDTSWLGEIKDKPLYNATGDKVATGNSGGICYPGALAAKLGSDDSLFF